MNFIMSPSSLTCIRCIGIDETFTCEGPVSREIRNVFSDEIYQLNNDNY